MKKSDLNSVEARLLLEREGISVGPSYHHKDYLFTSFTMPYPLKRKLDKLGRKFSLSRSKIIQMLIETADEENFVNDYLNKIDET
jgi:hypothetical protein